MIKLTVEVKAYNSIEDLFWTFVENNELLTVKASCEIKQGNENGFHVWALDLIPYNSEEVNEFMQLCSEFFSLLNEENIQINC